MNRLQRIAKAQPVQSLRSPVSSTGGSGFRGIAHDKTQKEIARLRTETNEIEAEFLGTWLPSGKTQKRNFMKAYNAAVSAHVAYCSAVICRAIEAAGAASFPPEAPVTPLTTTAQELHYEYPPEVKNIRDRCEANVVSFSNDDVSTLLVEIDRLAALKVAQEGK